MVPWLGVMLNGVKVLYNPVSFWYSKIWTIFPLEIPIRLESAEIVPERMVPEPDETVPEEILSHKSELLRV